MNFELLKPPRLRPGATIGVAAVSGPVDAVKLESGIAWLSARGYRVVEAKNVRRREGFLAGTDQERAEGYARLLCDPEIDAIFFLGEDTDPRGFSTGSMPEK